MTSEVACIFFFKRDVKLHDFTEACLRFTPRVAVREGEAIFLDMRGCASLNNDINLSRKLAVLLKRFNLNARVVFSTDAPTAFAKAICQCSKEDFPIEAINAYISPFSVDEQESRKISTLLTFLSLLGLNKLNEIFNIDTGALVLRFGKIADKFVRNYNQPKTINWPLFKVSEKIIEQIDDGDSIFDDSCLDSLFFGLKAIIDRAMARLKGRGERASSLRVELGLKKCSSRCWIIKLPFPQGSAFTLISILRDRMMFDLQRDPLSAGVFRIRVEILESVPGFGVQKDFFTAREEELETWQSLIARLSDKLGADNVFWACSQDRHLPEKAWKRIIGLNQEREVSERFKPITRPTRLLKTPLPLLQVGNRFIAKFTNGKSTTWVFKEVDGPERISGEWWQAVDKAGIKNSHRDYYKVRTQDGRELWIFCLNSSNQSRYFLHGYFD